MTKKKMGLLVMAYGTPYKEEDIEPYYTHIRRGRPPAPEQLEDLQNRYEAIGGISPLARITEDQANALCNRLNEVQNDNRVQSICWSKAYYAFHRRSCRTNA